MLVYGDRSERADGAERLQMIGEQLVRVARMPAGIDRHSSLVGALVEAGRLLQAVSDLDWPWDGLNVFVHRLAECALRSWDSEFAETGELPPIPNVEVPERVELKVPEGFAFYAVYPEFYAEAARRLKLHGPPVVIGIRSIGTTLGAIVAAALKAPPATTVRPFGDPFSRRVELPAELLADDAHYVIVDEGPGLSGSSFGTVADWLEQRGVPLERIAFLASHRGDVGPEASDAHRDRWGKAQRVAADFQPDFLVEMFGPLEELRTGARRKYLTHREGGRMLLKFAGLGAIGERKLEMARALHASGFTPEPLGLVHGFLVERWCEGARPLAQNENPVEEIGRYLGARARLFPVGDEDGAALDELLTMCRRNISLALGEDLAGRIGRCDPNQLPERSRVRSDNKPDREKWLRLPTGKLLKTDALDHHQAHDLVGCQPLEWDIAGAMIEFDLDGAEAGQLIRATGCSIDPDVIHFFRIAYAAFRLGQARLSAAVPDETRYAHALHHLLDEGTNPAKWRESLVG